MYKRRRVARLRDEYLKLLESFPRADLWHTIWNLFIHDPWFRKRLNRCARRALHGRSTPVHFREDVEQDVILRFAEKLHRDPRLNIHVEHAQHHFAGWLHRIIDRECRQATRQLRHQHDQSACLLAVDPETTSQQQVELKLDFWDCVRRLDDDERLVIMLYANGYPIRLISEALGLSVRTAYRLLSAAKQTLAGQLDADE